ncbi:MAG: hypothetical protein FJ224_05510 [Lentisphaerae bacterium]|nr:hypothetical protein [Lentisphaerota bacterium]
MSLETRHGRTSHALTCTAAVVLLMVAAQAVIAETGQQNSVQNGFGLAMTNGPLSALTSGGQSVAGRNSSGDGRFSNYSGFLAGIILQLSKDTDGDGLCDEMDADNDGDGAEDKDELVADTDPTNAASTLVFLASDPVADGVRLEWTGGVNARQILMKSSPPGSGNWIAVATNMPPTPVHTNFTDRTAGNGITLYRILTDRQGN